MRTGQLTRTTIDDLINMRVFAYKADDSEKRGRGRPRKSETNEFGQATIAQGNGLYNGLNLPFDPADLRTASGANIETAAKSDKILTPDGSSTLGVIDNAMQSQDGTEFPVDNIQANAGQCSILKYTMAMRCAKLVIVMQENFCLIYSLIMRKFTKAEMKR